MRPQRSAGYLALIVAMTVMLRSERACAAPSSSLWHTEAYLDLSYFREPEQSGARPWRSHGTSSSVNAFGANVGYLLVRKDTDPLSRWGMEFGFQDGPDTRSQIPATQPSRDRPIAGADTLRRLARANVSYLTNVGQGLLLSAGLINSFIGFESFYAKDNFNYTRSYIAENSPYFLLGMGVQYPWSSTLKSSLYVVNGYNYLSQPNDVPSLAGQLAWQLSALTSVTENLYLGSDQHDTELANWRFFSDTLVQRKSDRLTLALAFDVGTERKAERSKVARAFWMGGAAFANWRITEHWSLAFRPEFYWDPDGRLTGSRQLFTAATVTTQYAIPYGGTTTSLRLEYRYDHVEGRDAGFYVADPEQFPDQRLTLHQHLLIVSLLWSFSF